jgi:predicted HD superfamily hydrolase involved in NAD metabolism
MQRETDLRPPPFGDDLAALAARLRETVPEKRYVHSLGVADEAWRLAALHGADRDRARLAGLLHDCAKGIPKEDQAAACDRLGVPLDPATRALPQVIHGFLGERIARDRFGIGDEAVLRAIRLHTVGGAGMTLLDKVVFLADGTEPGRHYPGVEEVRAAADRDVDEALRLFLDGQLRYLAARGGVVHPATLRLREELG